MRASGRNAGLIAIRKTALVLLACGLMRTANSSANANANSRLIAGCVVRTVLQRGSGR